MHTLRFLPLRTHPLTMHLPLQIKHEAPRLWWTGWQELQIQAPTVPDWPHALRSSPSCFYHLRPAGLRPLWFQDWFSHSDQLDNPAPNTDVRSFIQQTPAGQLLHAPRSARPGAGAAGSSSRGPGPGALSGEVQLNFQPTSALSALLWPPLQATTILGLLSGGGRDFSVAQG